MKAVFLDTETLGPDDVDLAPLKNLLPELECFAATTDKHLAARIAQAEIVLINKVDLSAEVLRSATNLKLVCLAATGTDNVDLAAAADAGIVVSNIRNYCAPSVAQHVFALILALTQRLGDYERAVRSGAWQRGGQFCLLDFPIRELRDKKLGIIGLGSLGTAVAHVAQAFGMHILAARRPYDPTDVERPEPVDQVRRVGLGALFADADVISLHCPLNPDTADLIDAAALAAMRDDAILINTARGGLVDSAALVAALRSGQIDGAGIDVLRQEPPTGPDPVIDTRLPNLIVTPHIAWAGRESRQRAVAEMAKNVAGFLAGQPRNNVA